MFTLCSPCVHTVFTLCSLCAHNVFTRCSFLMMMPLICSCINEKTTLSHIPVGYPPPGMKKSHVMMLVMLCSHCVHAVFTLCSRGEGERATTLSSQTTGHRAGSVHLVEKLCTFSLLDIQKHSWRASGQEGPRGIDSGCEAHSARTRHNTTCIKQGYKTSAKDKQQS